jgi:hypothetical protein
MREKEREFRHTNINTRMNCGCVFSLLWANSKLAQFAFVWLNESFLTPINRSTHTHTHRHTHTHTHTHRSGAVYIYVSRRLARAKLLAYKN